MTSPSHAEMCDLPVDEMRARIRSGAYRGQTAGLAKGKLQANLVILPLDLARDFQRFCTLNAQPCPLVGMTAPGDPMMTGLGDIDIRTDVPSYNVYRHGELVEARHDVSDLWRDDFVAFALGCSFTFERALVEAGIDLRHITENRTVSMYRTNLALAPVGPFSGEMVVSMRPIPAAKVEAVNRICDSYVHAHGRPVHAGDPAGIGVADIDRPDWGDPAEIRAGEVPVFWACGVTPQNVLANARPPICITHTPGRMIVTDAPEDVPPAVAETLPADPAMAGV